MTNGQMRTFPGDADPFETKEWMDSLEYIVKERGSDRALWLLERLEEQARQQGVAKSGGITTPYCNTIPPEKEAKRPGDLLMQKRIKNLIRWNAICMVVRANIHKGVDGIGGHISTFASSATLYEVGFNHFFKGLDAEGGGDSVYFQGHASPGIYARAFIEGRLNEKQLENFRRELGEGGGLSSYPHPWLMPDFWQFPTVSMGLGPIMSIYHARFNRYLHNRGLKDTSKARVWAFLGDGETDEPESLGSITLAAREKLDNLTWVVNCNLQRLDGPVRGNGKIIQELEGIFRGAGWNVIKVVWSQEWDAMLKEDTSGKLLQLMMEVVDGQYQKYTVSTGEWVRKDFFGRYAETLKLAEKMTDEQVHKIRRGGHDSDKVFAAYHAAVNHKGAPTVILAKTIKGYGLGEFGEGQNTAHNQKTFGKTEEDRRRALLKLRDAFQIPLSDEDAVAMKFYKPAPESAEAKFLAESRKALGGSVPQRRANYTPIKAPALEAFAEFFKASDAGKDPSTTMAFVRILGRLLGNKEIGKYIVPIVPDEGRTFGLEGLYSSYKLYASQGQLYTPVDAGTLQTYKEATNGQFLQEGINEAGAMAEFIAAGTAYSVHGTPTIPFYIYYSMFGFQRIGDLAWAAADMRCKGFLIGGTAGRTTLNGEGLQHEDGHSHLLASTIPNIVAYDPSFAYEIAVIVQDGIRRMYEVGEDVYYYITVGNENYAMPAKPDGVEAGILKGLYKFRPAAKKAKVHAHLLGSGSIMNCVLKAQELLAGYGVAADVWSATSYKSLRYDGMECSRWNMLHPEAEAKVPYVTQLFANEKGPVVAASDYMRIVAEQIAPFIPSANGFTALGTDGFGRSESRANLRRHFEVDGEHIAVATLYALAQRGEIGRDVVAKAIRELNVDPEQVFSLHA